MNDIQPDPKFVVGPACGDQTDPDYRIDGDDGDIPAPLTTVGPDGQTAVLTPSPVGGPTNRYHVGKLVWAAKYTDGNIIYQYNDDVAVSTDNIPRNGLRSFVLIDGTGKSVFSQSLTPGKKFIYRRRTALRTGNDVIEVIHVVGWQLGDDDDAVHSIAFIFESNMRIEVGDFDRSKTTGYGRPDQWKYDIKYTDADRLVIT